MKELYQSFTSQMIAAYRKIHECTPPFEGKNAVNFAMVGAIVEYNHKAGNKPITELFGCSDCAAMLAYHNHK